MNWKIYSEGKPKPFKQAIAYNPKWKVNKIVLGYLDGSGIDEKSNYVLLIPAGQKFHSFEGGPAGWIGPEGLVKDVGLNGAFESFNHVFDPGFWSMEWKLINIWGAVQTKTNIIEIVNTKLKETDNEN